jgi:hypothetical protein
MAQAKSVHSTPPTNSSASEPQSSRRGFLVQAAGVAAAGAALGAGLPLPASSSLTLPGLDAEADPIFAAIEAHRKAIAAHSEAVGTEGALEESLPDDQQRSVLTVWREEIVETDDPSWIAAVQTRWEASESMDDLAINLLNTEPTTVAGVDALLRYFADQEEGLFPEKVNHDDGSEGAFGAFLVRHAADALRKIARPDCRIAQQLDEVLA